MRPKILIAVDDKKYAISTVKFCNNPGNNLDFTFLSLEG